MIIAILLLALCGLSWTAIGCIVSACSHKGGDYAVVQGWYSFWVAVVAIFMLALARFTPGSMGYMTAWPADKTVMTTVAIWLFLGGILNYLVFIFTGKAMAIGHTGLTWAMMQSSLISTFLMGVFCFGETPAPLKVAGVALIVAGLFFMSCCRNANGTSDATQKRKWILLTLLAMVISMGTQCLCTLPSFWLKGADQASTSFRTLWCNVGMVFCFIIHAILNRGLRRLPTKTENTYVAILAGFGVATGIVIFYHALDMLRPSGLAGIGYPIALGVCILGVELYSVFFTKEKTSPLGWFGILVCIAGIVALSCN